MPQLLVVLMRSVIFVTNLKVGSSSCVSCVASPSVVGSSEVHDVTSVFAQCSSSSFVVHQALRKKKKQQQ